MTTYLGFLISKPMLNKGKVKNLTKDVPRTKSWKKVRYQPVKIEKTRLKPKIKNCGICLEQNLM